MNEAELRTLINQPENPKLEFKREFYQIHHKDQQVRKQQWGELIKDILALANGNVGFAGKAGYLVIGVDEQRNLYNCTYTPINKQQILQKVNNYCHPPLPDLQVESVSIDGKKLIVIIIPPTPHLHETTQEIQTSNKRVFPAHITFVREGDSIVTASEAVREAIKKEKVSSPDVRAIKSLRDRIISIEENIEKNRHELDNIFDEISKLRIQSEKIQSEIRELQTRKYFLENKLSIRENKLSGIDLIKYAKRLKNQFSHDFIRDEVRSEIEDVLRKAIESQGLPVEELCWAYQEIVKLFDEDGNLIDAYEFGVKALQAGAMNRELRQSHLDICRSIYLIYPDYAKEAMRYIKHHEQILAEESA